MSTSTTLEWLAAVKSRFGVDYYQNMLEDLTDGNSSEHWAVLLNEHYIYACPSQHGHVQGRRGSSRIGIEERNKILAMQPSLVYQANYFSTTGDSSYIFDYSSDSILYCQRGDKRYELSNHLGNVLAVITDRRIQTCGMGEVMFYEPQVVTITDYYPGGLQIKERCWKNTVSYPYGFNGKEIEIDISSEGVVYDYGMRIYDSRIGKFLSTDPLSFVFAMFSPYQYASNNPIALVDLDGLEGVIPKDDPTDQGLTSTMKQLTSPIHPKTLIHYQVTIVHKRPDGTTKVVTYDIWQDRSHSYSNFEYLFNWSLQHPIIAFDVANLAEILDPAASWSGFFGWDSRTKRNKSVVGYFINEIADNTEMSYGEVSGSFGKMFRHQIYAGLLYSIYGEEMAKEIGDWNEMGNKGKWGLFKLDRNLIGTVDLMNNAYGIEHMKMFVEEYGEIETLDDFVKYLNYVSRKITEYEGEGFEAVNGTSVEFTVDTEGVRELYQEYTDLKEKNSE